MNITHNQQSKIDALSNIGWSLSGNQHIEGEALIRMVSPLNRIVYIYPSGMCAWV